MIAAFKFRPRYCRPRYSGFSMTFAQLAAQVSSSLDYVVWDRTGTDSLFNFTIAIDQGGGTLDERYARVLADMGLKLDLVKGPAQHLVIESVQPLRSAFAKASADKPSRTEASTGR